MCEMGVGVVKGAWTTFLGVFSLIFSSSAGFRGFFYVFAGIILVAVANGLFFVPSVLAELPCLYNSHHPHDDGEHGDDNKHDGVEPGARNDTEKPGMNQAQYSVEADQENEDKSKDGLIENNDTIKQQEMTNMTKAQSDEFQE